MKKITCNHKYYSTDDIEFIIRKKNTIDTNIVRNIYGESSWVKYNFSSFSRFDKTKNKIELKTPILDWEIIEAIRDNRIEQVNCRIKVMTIDCKWIEQTLEFSHDFSVNIKWLERCDGENDGFLITIRDEPMISSNMPTLS